MIVARAGHGRAVKAFQPLGIAALDGEGRGDVVGDVARAKRDRAKPDEHAAKVHGHVGHFGAHFDQSDAELALLVAQTSERGGDGRGDDRTHAEVRLADDGVDIAQRRGLGGDHVDVDAETIGVEPNRLPDALRAIDGVQRRMRMEHDLAVAVDGVLADGHQLVDVGLLDRMTAELDLDIGDVADQPAGAVAGPDLLDRLSGHALGQLDRLANRMLARRHVGDEAALDAAALTLARAEDDQATVVVRPRDNRADLRRPDIECRDRRPVGGLGH